MDHDEQDTNRTDDHGKRGEARSFTTSPTYREAIKRRRCLVPADWFYEWQKLDAKTKQPYAIALKDNSMFAFAGLWERWKDKASGQALETYTVITTDPNELMEPIHNRMPVILAPKDYERWLQPGEPSHLPVDLLRSYPAEEMKDLEGEQCRWQREEQLTGVVPASEIGRAGGSGLIHRFGLALNILRISSGVARR